MRGSHTVAVCTACAKPSEGRSCLEKYRRLKELARESNSNPSICTGSAHQLRDYAIIIALYWCKTLFGRVLDSFAVSD
jgi:hypothetical protein